MSNAPVASISENRPIRRTMPLAIGLCMALLASQVHAAVLSTDDFETGTNTNWTANNAGSQWAVDTTSEAGNAFMGRNGASASWSDFYGATSYADSTVEAWIRVNNWNNSTQNRVYLFARANNVSSTDTFQGYQVSIAPDSTITIEKRTTGKTIAVLGTGHGQDELGLNWNIGNWNKIRLEVSGSSTVSLAIYINGVQVATATDSSSPFASGPVGFGTSGADADFDDVTIGDGDDMHGLESDQYARLSTQKPGTPLKHNAAQPAVILASARSSKVGA